MTYLFYLNQYNQQRQREKKRWVYPVLLAMYATYLKKKRHSILWDFPKIEYTQGDFYDQLISDESQIDVPFLELPHPDRNLTRAKDLKWQQNGNFKYTPGTYIMSSNTCWWKKCTFCKEKNSNSPYKLRSYYNVLDEIDMCVEQGYKEIFDDSGTFPTGEWLNNFCDKMQTTHLNKKVRLGCNMRFGKLDKTSYHFLKNSGFRMLLYGLESAQQKTIDRIHKGFNLKEAIFELITASQAGLEPHVAVMFGYPWETHKDAQNTLRMVHWLLKKGYAKTAQASFYTNYDGSNEDHRKYVSKIYDVWRSPTFWFNTITNLRTAKDVEYLWKKIKAAFRDSR